MASMCLAFGVWRREAVGGGGRRWEAMGVSRQKISFVKEREEVKIAVNAPGRA
jgi:hypothetical protein